MIRDLAVTSSKANREDNEVRVLTPPTETAAWPVAITPGVVCVPEMGRDGLLVHWGARRCEQIGGWTCRCQGFERLGRGVRVQAAVRYSLMSVPRVVWRWIGSAEPIQQRLRQLVTPSS